MLIGRSPTAFILSWMIFVDSLIVTFFIRTAVNRGHNAWSTRAVRYGTRKTSFWLDLIFGGTNFAGILNRGKIAAASRARPTTPAASTRLVVISIK